MALPGALVHGVRHFLEQTVYSRIFAIISGKIIVPVHLNSPPHRIWTSSASKTLKSEPESAEMLSFLLPKFQIARCPPILKKKILSGMSFTKINKNCPIIR